VANTIQESVIETVASNGLPEEFAAYILAVIEISGGNRQMPATDQTRFTRTMERILCEDLKQTGSIVVTLPTNNPRTG
jgi:hypothetical protein